MLVGASVMVCWASPPKWERSAVLPEDSGVGVYSPEFQSFWVIGSLFPRGVPEVFESPYGYRTHLQFDSQSKEEIPNLVFKFL